MAGTITALKVQKRNKERVNVFIDDQFALAVTVLAALNLRKGQYLSDVEIENLRHGDERDKAYNHSVRFLSFRPRSRQEIVRYLRDKGYVGSAIDDTLDRLIEQQYVDDQAFAQFWLENREQHRPRGERALRYELRQKGIADTVINKVLADLDEDELAWRAVENKLHYWKNLTAEALKKKMFGYLTRRGFGYDVARRTYDRALEL